MKRLGMFIVAVALLGESVSAAEKERIKYLPDGTPMTESEYREEMNRRRMQHVRDRVGKDRIEREVQREMISQRARGQRMDGILATAEVMKRNNLPIPINVQQYVNTRYGTREAFLRSQGRITYSRIVDVPESNSMRDRHPNNESSYKTVRVNGRNVGEMDISGDRTYFRFRNGMKGYSETSPNGWTTIYMDGGGRMTID